MTTVTSRKTARAALAGLLKTAMEGITAQKVYAYPPKIVTESPVVIVRSASSQRLRRGIGQTKSFNTFTYEVMVFVAAANEDASWTPSAAADALDDLEAAVNSVVISNPTNAAWGEMHIADRPTEIIRLPASSDGGSPYDVEIVTVEMKVYDT